MADIFWNWGSESKVHWKAWLTLCLPTVKGGLGFRRLKEYNLTLLAKQASRVSLGRGGILNEVLDQKYFLGSTFFEARLGSSPSLTWRSIWDARDLLAAGIRWKVGNGRSITVLGYPWLPAPRLSSLLPPFFSPE
ncbi:UNVERIFIED_CONTAM: hypothetical protein Sradi_0707000 [Sesamum radiatum]|uniref:Reverse transcriptase n=1 Tax=Sesamum radiatum TaxID=300843 RepID=A0AAW2VMZ2_SESRA